jgi:hypothetical protein
MVVEEVEEAAVVGAVAVGEAVVGAVGRSLFRLARCSFLLATKLLPKWSLKSF